MTMAIEPLGGHDRAAFSCAVGALEIEKEHIKMAKNYSFSVILEPQEGGGFTVLVPSLPEVVTEGDDEKEALANAEEAIRAILAYRRDNGIAIPADARPEVRRITIAA
jgi:antitoxin HicB